MKNEKIKYTISSVQQDKLIELGLDIKDAYIISYIKELTSRKIIQKIVDNQVFYWVDYQNLLSYLPVLEINCSKTIGRRFSKYENLGLIKKHEHKNFNNSSGEFSGTYNFISLEEKFEYLFEISKIDEDLEDMERKAQEMGLVTEVTQKFPREKIKNSPRCSESHLIGGASKVPSIEVPQKSPLNTTINNTTINTTTNKEKNSSSSENFSFLKKEKYIRLNHVTKKLIKKEFPNITEEEFEKIYKLTEADSKKGLVQSFNAVLFKGLKGEWEYSLQNKQEKEPVKEITASEKDLLKYKQEICLKIDAIPDVNFGWKSVAEYEIGKLKSVEEINNFLKKHKIEKKGDELCLRLC